MYVETLLAIPEMCGHIKALLHCDAWSVQWRFVEIFPKEQHISNQIMRKQKYIKAR
jgi:hypothetical protein